MSRIGVLHLTFWMFLISLSNAAYDEMYRPQLHYSPPKGMLNDPNGLVYKDGIFHLFYQCRPDDVSKGK